MEEDFISQLPDDILLQIFSHLDAAAIFQCSTLSKRWTSLWKVVDFPEDLVSHNDYFRTVKKNIHEVWVDILEEASNRMVYYSALLLAIIIFYHGVYVRYSYFRTGLGSIVLTGACLSIKQAININFEDYFGIIEQKHRNLRTLDAISTSDANALMSIRVLKLADYQPPENVNICRFIGLIWTAFCLNLWWTNVGTVL